MINITDKLKNELPGMIDSLIKSVIQETTITISQEVCLKGMVCHGREALSKNVGTIIDFAYDRAASFGAVTNSQTRCHPSGEDPFVVTVAITFTIISSPGPNQINQLKLQ